MDVCGEECIYLHGLGEIICDQPLVCIDQVVLLKVPDYREFTAILPRLIVVGLNNDPSFIQELVKFAAGVDALYFGVGGDFRSVDSQESDPKIGQLYAKAQLNVTMDRVAVTNFCYPTKEQIRAGVVLQFIGEFGIEAFSGRRHERSIWPLV